MKEDLRVIIKCGQFSKEVTIPEHLQTPVPARRPDVKAVRIHGRLTLWDRIKMKREFADIPAEEVFLLGAYPSDQAGASPLDEFVKHRRFTPTGGQKIVDKARAIRFGVKIGDEVYDVAEESPWMQTSVGGGQDDTSGVFLVGRLGSPKPKA